VPTNAQVTYPSQSEGLKSQAPLKYLFYCKLNLKTVDDDCDYDCDYDDCQTPFKIQVGVF